MRWNLRAVPMTACAAGRRSSGFRAGHRPRRAIDRSAAPVFFEEREFPKTRLPRSLTIFIKIPNAIEVRDLALGWRLCGS